MFDSHAHVNAKQFDADRHEVIERGKAEGLTGWLEVGSSMESSRRAVGLAERTEGVWASVGVHPDEITGMKEDDWRVLEEMADKKKVVAIGEVGLDFHRGGKYEQQISVVERFVQLAVKLHKPIVWHVRGSAQMDANELLLGYLTGLPEDGRPGGVAHTFSGTVAQAQRYVELGLYLGISGIVTFKNAGVLLDVVRVIDLRHLLIETDSPYLAPDPWRGQRNEPRYVKLVVQKIAELKGIEMEEVEKKSYGNFKRMVDSKNPKF